MVKTYGFGIMGAGNISSAYLRLAPLFKGHEGRERDEQYVAPAVAGTQRGGQLAPIDPRHGDIEDRHVGPESPVHHTDGRSAIVTDRHVVSRHCQHLAERIRCVRIVVDAQDAERFFGQVRV